MRFAFCLMASAVSFRRALPQSAGIGIVGALRLPSRERYEHATVQAAANLSTLAAELPGVQAPWTARVAPPVNGGAI